MNIYCPFCEEEITNNIKLNRRIDKTLLLTTEFCDENAEYNDLDLETVLDEIEEDTYLCGECDNDITNFILVEKKLLY